MQGVLNTFFQLHHSRCSRMEFVDSRRQRGRGGGWGNVREKGITTCNKQVLCVLIDSHTHRRFET